MNSAGGWNVLTTVYACWRALEHCSCLLSLLLCQQCSFCTGLLLFKWTLGRLGERFRLSTLSSISLFSFWTVNSWVKCIPTTAGETGHCLQCLLSCRIIKNRKQLKLFPVSILNVRMWHKFMYVLCAFGVFYWFYFFPHLVLCLCCVLIFFSISEVAFILK